MAGSGGLQKLCDAQARVAQGPQGGLLGRVRQEPGRLRAVSGGLQQLQPARHSPHPPLEHLVGEPHGAELGVLAVQGQVGQHPVHRLQRRPARRSVRIAETQQPGQRRVHLCLQALELRPLLQARDLHLSLHLLQAPWPRLSSDRAGEGHVGSEGTVAHLLLDGLLALLGPLDAQQRLLAQRRPLLRHDGLPAGRLLGLQLGVPRPVIGRLAQTVSPGLLLLFGHLRLGGGGRLAGFGGSSEGGRYGLEEIRRHREHRGLWDCRRRAGCWH
mmetsp:Transcript_24076/g.32999  ORF Transcript_24076/g.32999 Transcript_24076/m.32999 type:complete len:271 (-) Transcript_24076:372-1184(-)